jgi:hypothetical protein
MDNLVGSVLEGSDDNTNWSLVYSFDSILAGWNRFRPEDSDVFKF